MLDTTSDCLRFVTEFFEVISQSAPHIYDSALLLAPQSSIIWKLYRQYIPSSKTRVVTGIPTLWDSCTAAGASRGYFLTWSPCGQLIATVLTWGVALWDSSTLERLSTLVPLSGKIFGPLAFSPDGHLLACSSGHDQ